MVVEEEAVEVGTHHHIEHRSKFRCCEIVVVCQSGLLSRGGCNMDIHGDIVGAGRDNADTGSGGTSSREMLGYDLVRMTTGCNRMKQLEHCYSLADNLDTRKVVATSDNDRGTSLAVEMVHFDPYCDCFRSDWSGAAGGGVCRCLPLFHPLCRPDTIAQRQLFLVHRWVKSIVAI